MLVPRGTASCNYVPHPGVTDPSAMPSLPLFRESNSMYFFTPIDGSAGGAEEILSAMVHANRTHHEESGVSEHTVLSLLLLF